MSLPRTRKEARALGLSRFFNGKPCVHGHIAERYASGSECTVCCKKRAAARYREDPNPFSEASRKWRERHGAAYREAKREQLYKWSREYVQKNPDLYRTLDARRRARKRNATPPWFSGHDEAAIRRTYALASLMAEVTGEPWEVDHIIPLGGRNVCGLHVASNVQAISRRANRRKSNRFEAQEVAA